MSTSVAPIDLAVPADLATAADLRASVPPPVAPEDRSVFLLAAWHSLLWLVLANGVGVLIAAMLLLPGINGLLGEWTYGTWLPVHMNLQLYGWCSLPLVGFLFHVYGVDRGPAARWVSPVLCLWSLALGMGAVSWLGGHSSGKLFLDWVGLPRVLFPLALLALWTMLTYAFARHWKHPGNRGLVVRTLKSLGLLLLAAVPFLIYVASDPAIYQPINPDTGGPTGASQLESTLVIIAILLLLPMGLVSRKASRGRWALKAAWMVFAAEALLCLALGRADVSHHRPTQWISLGSLLIWIPLMPAYYAAFAWHPKTRMWRTAMLVWWSVLVPTGWMLFLPGVLDHFKFTDGLVGHSLLAMAGFVSSLLIFVMVQLLGDDGWIFHTRWAFALWNGSVALYVAVMFFAGWREGSDPAFSILPGPVRNGIYIARLSLGVLMLAASADWLYWASGLLRQRSGKPVIARPATARQLTAKPATAEPVGARPVTARPVTAKPVTAKPVTAELV